MRFSRLAVFLVICCMPLAGSSCIMMSRWITAGWVADYDSAEQLVRDSGEGMLILYSSISGTERDPVETVLNDPRVRERTTGYVRCKLFRSYESDRRYLAQFGITRAPAVILVHPDGTYHARAGSATIDDLLAFVDASKPPGQTPTWDPCIPRTVNYRWHDSVASARLAAQSSHRPMLVVFHRAWTRDWANLEAMLIRMEVYPRFYGMVHARVDSWSPEAGMATENFGVTTWPALVIVYPDESYSRVEMPSSYQQIVRFADQAKVGGRTPTAGPSASAATAP